jgi:hypothetical protein
MFVIVDIKAVFRVKCLGIFVTNIYTKFRMFDSTNQSLILKQGPLMVAQRLRYCAINRKVAGSIPDGVIGIVQ